MSDANAYVADLRAENARLRADIERMVLERQEYLRRIGAAEQEAGNHGAYRVAAEIDADRLREVVARVEGLAVEFSARQVKAIVASSRHPLDSASMAKEVGKGIGFSIAARMTRDALWPDEGSTDTDPAPTGPSRGSEGAGDGV